MGEGGGLYPAGLIKGCLFLYTGKWACNWGEGGGISVREGHKRKLTVFTTRGTYNSTH